MQSIGPLMATAFRELAFLAAQRVIDSLFQLLARRGAETSQNASAAISESWGGG
jgi:hypothetical protein